MQLLWSRNNGLRRVGRATVVARARDHGEASEVLEPGFFQQKDELRDGVTVTLPKQEKPFVLEPDASIHAGGAVLLESEGED